MAVLTRDAPPEGHVFEDIADAMPHMVWLAGPDGGTTYHNRRILGYAGLPAGITLGAGWERLVHPDDVPATRATWLHSVGTGEPFETEYRLRRYDGAYRWFLVRAHTQLDDRGEVVRWVGTCTDIEDQKGEESRFRAIIEKSFDGVDLVAADGTLIYSSPSSVRLLGVPVEEQLGRDAFELLHPDDRDALRAVFRRLVLTPGASADSVHRARHADGRYLWLEFRATNLLFDPGVRAVVVNFRDVSDRVAADGELRRTAELLKAVADGTTDALFVKDRDGKYLLANPATARFVGRTEGDVLGRTDAELFDPDSARRVAERDRQVMTAGVAETNVEELTAAGVTRTYLATKAPYRDEDGAVIGIIGITRDVTELKRLAEERDALLARLQLQFARMPLAYVQFDADLRVTDWNPAAERIFGFSKDEVLGMGPPYEKIVPITFWAEVVPLLARIKAGDMAAHSVNQNLTKDGRTITCEWFNTPLLDEGGRFTGLLCLAQDVTARLLLEEQFRQAQKMDAFGQLAGGVAHDFNNLLTIINGYSDIVLDSLPPGDPNRELVAEVYKAGQRSAGLTRQLLAFSRRQVLALRVLDLNVVVGDTASMLRRVIGEDVKLSTTTANGLWLVKADPGQIEQILLNLAVNARDAMPTGGKLTIETGNVELDETYAASHPDARAGSHVLLAVSDNGCGMSAAVRAKIFEPFFTTKGPGKGTGLGLATVYGIVKQSGGVVDVYSEVGVGTTFKVYLPRTEQAGEGAKPHSALRAPPRGTETVLVVEDDAVVRALIRHILQHAGYAVLEAAGGDEALRVATGHTGRIHLLITDVVMPGLGGPAAAERLAERHHGLRVLFVSGYTDDAVVRHGVLHDKVNFLQKPFTPAALAWKVREVLDQPST